jgi:hypothetical protein
MKDKVYNENKIIIKNYSYLFNSFSPLMLFLGFAIPIAVIWKYMNIFLIGEGDINLTFYISVIALSYMIKVAIQRLHGFKLKPPVFIISEDNLIYDHFVEDYKFRNIVKKDVASILRVKFIVNSETINSYGKVNKNSLIKRFFKDDIGDGFIWLVTYYLGLISFFFFYMPIKIVVLLKNREKLSLLKKNLLIEFNDQTAYVINIYSESDYEKVYSILKKNQIKIDNKIVLSINLKKEK